jgi:anti-sigma regulatory factor (Ser/Thr protein kinase)
MRILMVTLQREQDVVFTRQQARQIAQLLGFDVQDQTRIATAVSEIARNALSYASGGQVEFNLEGQTRPQLLQVSVSDKGPGIPHLQEILAGQYQSLTGLVWTCVVPSGSWIKCISRPRRIKAPPCGRRSAYLARRQYSPDAACTSSWIP